MMKPLSLGQALRLGTLLLLCSASPAMAQHEAGGHTTLPDAAAAVPVARAPAASDTSAAKQPARKARPQLGIGTAFAPDGSLWWTGLNAENQLLIQSAPVAPGHASGSGSGANLPLRLQWSAPRVIDTAGDTLSADGENRPKLLFGANNVVLIAYTQARAKPNTGWVRMLRSVDGGKTFSAPYTVHADRQEITHRFESIGFDAQGVLHAIWIDKRDLEAAPRLGHKSSYRGAAIYRASSTDGGLTFGPDTKVADHSCECCRIALTQGRDGVLRAMWRHVFEPNVRDHAFAALVPEPGSSPSSPSPSPSPGSAPAPALVRATFDEWRIDACPHHGPGLAGAADGGFHAVWFGIRQEGDQSVPGVRYGRLGANGSPMPDTMLRLPDGRAEHADVAATGQRVAVVWRSTDGLTSTLKAWLSSDGGRSFRVRQIGQASGDNDYPRLAQRGDQLLVVWRNAKEVQVYELKF